jgi:ABC-2 type transport system permease protein
MSGAVAIAWRQYRLERKLFWRNPSAAFFNFTLPLLFLAFFGLVFHNHPKELKIVVPGIAGMSVMSTTFTALAFNMTFLREQGVLKRIRGTPMPGLAYLAGIAGNAVTNAAVQITIITIAGNLFFGTGWPKEWVELIVFVIVGVVCFASLGVAYSHAIPNFESAPAYVNAVFLPLVAISGVFFDPAHTPAFMRGIAQVFPLYHLIVGLAGAMVTGKTLAENIGSLAVVAVWTVLGLVLAVRGFSWDQRRS